MQSKPLSLTARTLYAELRELALAIGAMENVGQAPGSIVPKSVRAPGRAFCHKGPGG